MLVETQACLHTQARTHLSSHTGALAALPRLHAARYNYGQYSYGLYTYGLIVMAYTVVAYILMAYIVMT